MGCGPAVGRHGVHRSGSSVASQEHSREVAEGLDGGVTGAVIVNSDGNRTYYAGDLLPDTNNGDRLQPVATFREAGYGAGGVSWCLRRYPPGASPASSILPGRDGIAALG